MSATEGPKGPFRKNVFFVGWARIHGERPLFEEGERNWGVKWVFSQKWIFKCLGEDSWRRLGFLVLGRFAGLN